MIDGILHKAKIKPVRFNFTCLTHEFEEKKTSIEGTTYKRYTHKCSSYNLITLAINSDYDFEFNGIFMPHLR